MKYPVIIFDGFIVAGTMMDSIDKIEACMKETTEKLI